MGDSTRFLKRVVIVFVVVPLLASMIFGTANAATSKKIAYPEMIVPVREFQHAMYIVDSVGCLQLFCLRLYRTTSSATNFRLRTLPRLGEKHTTRIGDLDTMTFQTPRYGFALVGDGRQTLYATSNGARSWHRVSMGRGVTVIGITTNRTSIIATIATCNHVGNSCHDYRIARADLSAKKWRSIPIPKPKNFPMKDVEFSWTLGTYFPNVWLSEQDGPNGVLFFSGNDAKSFVQLRKEAPASVAGCALDAMSFHNLWAQCPTGMAVSFARSNATSKGWGYAQIPYQFAGTGGGDFDPVSDNLAYLAYGLMQKGLFVKITGADRRVSVIGRLACSSKGSTISGLTMTNEVDGLAICAPENGRQIPVLLRTSDGGVNWLRGSAN